MTDEITPKAGERWRVTIEAEVCDNTGTWVYTSADDGDQYTLPAYGAGVTWERLPDPEPEWQPGDLVIADDGQVWVRAGSAGPSTAWYRPNDDGWFAPEGYPVRPLTRLIRESK